MAEHSPWELVLEDLLGAVQGRGVACQKGTTAPAKGCRPLRGKTHRPGMKFCRQSTSCESERQTEQTFLIILCWMQRAWPLAIDKQDPP